jgi:phage tail-like protein
MERYNGNGQRIGERFSGAFLFWVEIKGIVAGGFSEVSALTAETEVEEYREGGVNGYVHQLPKGTKFSPIVLKRGVTTSTQLWDWYTKVIHGNIERKDGSIVLVNMDNEEVARWNFFGAYPVKWIGPELNASRGEVAVETVELVYRELKLFK